MNECDKPAALLARLSRLLIFLIALGLPAYALRSATAEEPQAPSPRPAPTNSFKLPEVPDLDTVKVGNTRVSLAPGAADADVSSDLPLPLGPAAAPVGGGRSKEGGGEWVAAPIPFLKPTFGWGVALGAGYIYQPLSDASNSNAPPWVTGIGGFYAENESWGVGGGHKMNLGDDRWRLLGGGGYADLHYDFYGVGSDAANAGRSVSLNQRVGGGVAEVLRQVTGDWYAGVRYMLGNSRTAPDSVVTNQPPSLTIATDQLSANVAALGLHLQRDSRDSQFYPTRGSLLDVEANFFEDAFGSDFTFQAYAISYNQYWSLATNHIVAVRGYGRFTSGNVPFFALCSFGSKGDLRGYTPGRYRDKMMLATQAEYRWRVTQRFGLAAFGGIGGVAPELGEFDTALPSGGVGARYVLAKKNNVSFRFDAAWGKNEHAIYLGIGEAF